MVVDKWYFLTSVSSLIITDVGYYRHWTRQRRSLPLLTIGGIPQEAKALVTLPPHPHPTVCVHLIKSFSWTHPQISLTMTTCLRHDPSHGSQIKREPFLLKVFLATSRKQSLAHCHAHIASRKPVPAHCILLTDFKRTKICAYNRRGTLQVHMRCSVPPHRPKCWGQEGTFIITQ